MLTIGKVHTLNWLILAKHSTKSKRSPVARKKCLIHIEKLCIVEKDKHHTWICPLSLYKKIVAIIIARKDE